MRDEEASKSKKQLKTLEEQAHLYQKKYEDALALLEESNRQKRRIQELSARTTDGLNIEVRICHCNSHDVFFGNESTDQLGDCPTLLYCSI